MPIYYVQNHLNPGYKEIPGIDHSSKEIETFVTEYGTVFGFGFIDADEPVEIPVMVSAELQPANPVEYSKLFLYRFYRERADGIYQEIAAAIGAGRICDLSGKYDERVIHAAGTRFISENKPVTTSDFCEVLSELGKGYDYNRRYRNEPLAGVYWGNEGFYNFVLRVVHVITGFDNPSEREKYFENVRLQSRLDDSAPY